jgi:AcrR family transcriptional regulator
MRGSAQEQPETARRRPYAPRLPPGERRQQLIDAALGLILDKGYSAVSIEAVARIAGVTRPVVYDHFPNLGRLLAALVDREERYAVAQLEQLIPDDPGDATPQELLANAVRQFLHAVVDRPGTWRVILLPVDGTPGIIREQVEKQRARMQDRIARLVAWAQERPDFPAGLDVELTAHSIRTLCEEAGRLVLTDPKRYSPERFQAFVGAVVRLVWPTDGADH